MLHRTFALIDNFSAAFAALYFVGGVRVTFFLGVEAGGPQAYWISYLITCLFTFVTAAVLAEICSALPAAGSIYFWAAECAGPKYGRLAGFIVAWWSTTAWTTFVASNSQGGANYLLSEIAVFNLDFSTDTGDVHFRAVQWIVAEALLALSMSVQYMPPKHYRWVFRTATAVVLLDFFLNLIWFPIGVASTYGFRSAEYAFTHTENDIGAPYGWAWCLSFLATAGILVSLPIKSHLPISMVTDFPTGRVRCFRTCRRGDEARFAQRRSGSLLVSRLVGHPRFPGGDLVPLLCPRRVGHC